MTLRTLVATNVQKACIHSVPGDGAGEAREDADASGALEAVAGKICPNESWTAGEFHQRHANTISYNKAGFWLWTTNLFEKKHYLNWTKLEGYQFCYIILQRHAWAFDDCDVWINFFESIVELKSVFFKEMKWESPPTKKSFSDFPF